jgi:hypothetical protein
MTSRLYIQKRGPSGGSNIDLTDFTGRKGAPFFDDQASTIQLGQRAWMGEASQGTFLLMDPEAELPRADFNYNLPAHALVTWTEDAPGAEVWIARGRIAQSDGGRGLVPVDDEVEFENVVDDSNVELRGQAFEESWIRPSETDYARLVALQAYILNGSSSTADHHRDTCQVTVSSTHLAPNANTVTMPAKKYPPGTLPEEVAQDCAETAGKFYAVVIHHAGGSHLCLLYTTHDDHSTYASAAKISDHLDEWDPEDLSAPVLEPHWEAGKATLYDGQTLLSGMVGVYNSEEAVLVEYPGSDEAYDYWVEPYYDSKSTTEAQSAARTAGILEERRLTHVTHRVSVILLAEQIDLIAAGMSIQTKAAALIAGQYLDTWQTRRIAECQFEPRLDGRYWAHLQLDRPTLKVAPGRGSRPGTFAKPPETTVVPSAATDWLWLFDEDAFDTTDTSEGGPNWQPGFIYSKGLDPSANVDGVALAPGTYHFRCVMRSRSPVPTSFKGVRVRDGCHGGTTLAASANDVSTTAVTKEFDFTVPAGTHPGIFFDSTGTSGGANTEFHEAEISHGSATSGYVGTPPPPASTDSVGTIGTPGVYAPADHAHPAQSAAVTQVLDEDDHYDGADVETILAEIGDALANPTTNIEDFPTAETDTALVLAPDGAGGVEWRAETPSYVPLVSVVGGVPGFVFDANDELVLTEFTP